MAQFYSGIQGKMQWGSGTNPTNGGCEAKVVNWQFSIAQNLLDTTTLCSTDTTVIPGIRTTTGSCRLYYYGQNSSASQLINQIMKTGTEVGDGDNEQSNQVTFKLWIDSRFVTIPAYIENATMNCAVGEVVAVDITFKADGAALSNTL